jgi:hypothetical protein
MAGCSLHAGTGFQRGHNNARKHTRLITFIVFKGATHMWPYVTLMFNVWMQPATLQVSERRPPLKTPTRATKPGIQIVMFRKSPGMPNWYAPSRPTGPQKSDSKNFEPRNRACCLAGWPSPSSLCVDGETNQNWKPENHNCWSWKLFSLPKSRPRSLRRFLTRSCVKCVKENLDQKTWMYLPNINPFAPTCSCCSNCPALASSKVLLEDLGDRFSRWLKGKHHFTTRH